MTVAAPELPSVLAIRQVHRYRKKPANPRHVITASQFALFPPDIRIRSAIAAAVFPHTDAL